MVHSQPLDSPEFARALASGANSLVAADKVNDHFLAVLRMVSQGYLVADSLPMRSLIGVVRAGPGQRTADSGELPELTARESDILQSAARGFSIRQTARALGISPRPSRTSRLASSASLGYATGPRPSPWPTRLACCLTFPRPEPDLLTDSSSRALSSRYRWKRRQATSDQRA